MQFRERQDIQDLHSSHFSKPCSVMLDWLGACEDIELGFQGRTVQKIDLRCDDIEPDLKAVTDCISKLPMTNVLISKFESTRLLDKVSIGAFCAIAISLTTPAHATIWAHSISRHFRESGISILTLNGLNDAFVGEGYPSNAALMSLWMSKKSHEQVCNLN